MDIVAKQKKAEQESKTAEQNSAREQKNNEVIDIFSEMCSDTAPALFPIISMIVKQPNVSPTLNVSGSG